MLTEKIKFGQNSFSGLDVRVGHVHNQTIRHNYSEIRIKGFYIPLFRVQGTQKLIFPTKLKIYV